VADWDVTRPTITDRSENTDQIHREIERTGFARTQMFGGPFRCGDSPAVSPLFMIPSKMTLRRQQRTPTQTDRRNHTHLPGRILRPLCGNVPGAIRHIALDINHLGNTLRRHANRW